MAASPNYKSPSACSDLLHKLRQGQKNLEIKLESLRNESRAGERRRQVVQTRRHLIERPLNTIKDIPRKRARLELLSPGIEPEDTRKHPRRFSSTPKKCDKPLALFSARDVDSSLEEALLDPTSRPLHSTEHHKTNSTVLPSPKLSRVVVDTSRSIRDSSPTNSFAQSSLRKKSTSKRGLSVSFVGRESPSGSKHKQKESTERSKRHLFKKEKEIGESMVQSLNASRHGALDRSLSQRKSVQRFPRKFRGDDPKLGYDWIAGLLDASDSYLTERDEEYFEDLKEFRRVNCSECYKPREGMLPGSLMVTGPDVGNSSSHNEDRELVDSEDVNCTSCVKSYSLNNRLFPIPRHLNSDLITQGGHGILETCCPVCEDKHSDKTSPVRYIRVSVPKRTLQSSLHPRPHRRRSFDQTDSMGLSKHCLAGWETAQPSIIPPQPSVDLRAAVETSVGGTSRKQKASGDLLNTSHTVEYNLRSRSIKQT